jgi:tetratricopeptide (TPR) repeat protein
MCLWDLDTYLEEKLDDAAVSATLEGRFFKHSSFFYEQKIAYTTPLLAGPEALPERFDDVAVAWDKLGQPNRALEIIEAKEARFPGLYTSLANRGTFLAHRGDLEASLVDLREAVRINPDAHFGREHYQISAIEALLRWRLDPSLPEREDLLGFSLPSIAHYLRTTQPVAGPPGRGPAHRHPFPPGVEEDVFEALVGIIRFGNGDRFGPVWFSLGLALGAALGRHDRVVRAMRRAEILGHPLARSFGEIAAGNTPWAEAAAEADEDFAEGQREMAQKQTAEEERIHQGQLREVFGY